MNRRKFLVGVAAVGVVGPLAVESMPEYFPWYARFPTPEMVAAITPMTTPGVTVTMELIEIWAQNIVDAFGMRAEHLR